MQDVRLIAFPGAPNLPIFVAREQGRFEAEGVQLDLTLTPSSVFQAEGLAKGDFQIAGTAFDNVVAYRENQGAVVLDAPLDVFAFMGATRLELSFVVAPEYQTYANLKGAKLAMDALNTGFAFVLYHMLEANGLARDDYEMTAVGATPQRFEAVMAGEYAGTLTIEPFTSLARARGFHVLGSSQSAFDSYQGGVFATRRGFADTHPEAIAGFVRAYLQGLAWTLDAANRDEAAEVLLRNMPAIKPGVVDKVLANLCAPQTGLTPDGSIDAVGVDTVLALRKRFGGDPTRIGARDRYVDLSIYNQATSSDRAKSS